MKKLNKLYIKPKIIIAHRKKTTLFAGEEELLGSLLAGRCCGTPNRCCPVDTSCYVDGSGYGNC